MTDDIQSVCEEFKDILFCIRYVCNALNDRAGETCCGTIVHEVEYEADFAAPLLQNAAELLTRKIERSSDRWISQSPKIGRKARQFIAVYYVNSTVDLCSGRVF